MINGYDIAYGLGVAVSAPFWLVKTTSRQKVRRAFAQRMGQVPQRTTANPAVLIHAVSLGEINATRGLVQRLRQLRPDLSLIISTTTDTGFARAQELYGDRDKNPDTTVIRYPLDFTSAVAAVLDNLRPTAVVLMELEVWPNFLLQCQRRHIPVLLVNGRITEPSFRHYRWAIPVVRPMFNRLAAICAQDQTYAGRFVALGSQPDRVTVTGTMKFDTATVADRVDGDAQLASETGLPHSQPTPHAPVWVCGSTGPGEEQLVLDVYRQLLPSHPTLRLVLVPRKPERFDEVADLIRSAGFPLIRRSQTRNAPSNAPQPPDASAPTPVVLGDTMGELRKFYSLADVVFVGRTLVDLGPRQHGSDMIEPAALAKPVIVGPYTGNFADAMFAFRRAQALVEVATADELRNQVATLLDSPDRASQMGKRAQDTVKQEKGATERHVQIILKHI